MHTITINRPGNSKGEHVRAVEITLVVYSQPTAHGPRRPVPVAIVLSRRWSYIHAYSSYEHLLTWAVDHTSHSPHLLPFASVTHFYVDYCWLTDPGGMEGWVGLVSGQLISRRFACSFNSLTQNRESSLVTTDVPPAKLHRQNYYKKLQLMLTNPRDAFRGQSRSPNMVPFDLLGMVSY